MRLIVLLILLFRSLLVSTGSTSHTEAGLGLVRLRCAIRNCYNAQRAIGADVHYPCGFGRKIQEISSNP